MYIKNLIQGNFMEAMLNGQGYRTTHLHLLLPDNRNVILGNQPRRLLGVGNVQAKVSGAALSERLHSK
jgi:hypothetical protein